MGAVAESTGKRVVSLTYGLVGRIVEAPTNSGVGIPGCAVHIIAGRGYASA